MKNKSARLSISLLFVLASVTMYAQQFFVVVGTFTQKKPAEKFIASVKSKLNSTSVDYEMDVKKKYYYVYVLKTPDHKTGVAETRRIQNETEFKNVWLFSDKTGRVDLDAKIVEDKPVEKPVVVEANEVANKTPKDTTQVAHASTPHTPATDVKKSKTKQFKFIIETDDKRPIHASHGEIHEVNYQRGHHLASYKSDEYIDVPPPLKGNNPMTLVCGIFGYREVVKVIDFNNPSLLASDVAKDDNGAWVITYKLERMKAGDVSVMYHVFFHKDAVIMLPEAKPELDELVSMMKNNMNYKIKIHGHCTGNYTRKIIALGKTKNYFEVKDSQDVQGTAKELSKLRAEAVQSYLVDNGIDQSRITIFPWGAMNMLVPETSTSAKLNDRIEIEFE